jgi:hypothetical protein
LKKKKRKNKLSQTSIQYRSFTEILSIAEALSLIELIRLIHKINPTNESLGFDEVEKRYELKSSLQSLLINRFSESLTVVADSANPQLISLNFKHFSENGCHAIIADLDFEARSWVNTQLDYAKIKSSHRNQGKKNTKKLTDENNFSESQNCENINEIINNSKIITNICPVDEILKNGRRALEEFDYDTSERLFIKAFNLSNGQLAAATALFEFQVNYLAAYNRVIESVNDLAPASKKDPGIKLLIALAKARSGRVVEALGELGFVADEMAVEIYLKGADYYLSKGNIKKATGLYVYLTSFTGSKYKGEIIELGKKIKKLAAVKKVQ